MTPVAAQTVSVSRGVESHSSLAPTAARRADEALAALRVLVATELVVAVRALRLAGHEPVGAGTAPLYAAAAARLDPDLSDRPLHPDVEAARVLIASWPPGTDRSSGYWNRWTKSPTTRRWTRSATRTSGAAGGC